MQPPPSLHIAVSGNEVVLAWPNWARDFKLQVSEGHLPGSGAWTNIVTSPTTNGNSLTVVVPVGSEAQFFRLTYP
jgi:hypothetical protein